MMKWLQILALPALLLLALYAVDRRAEQRGKNEVRLEAAEQKQIVDAIVDEIKTEMLNENRRRDDELRSALENIRTVDRTIIKPTLVKEIQSDPRFSNPDVGITDGMFDSLNAARRLTGPSALVSRERSALPAARPLEGQEP